jgi:hypothetical protein
MVPGQKELSVGTERHSFVKLIGFLYSKKDINNN